ncbi:MAG: hypothetical protein QNJ27_03255 [Simkaniaceae bacterium]|nr:hypothetical protein [Simkaniaceae bacterium]
MVDPDLSHVLCSLKTSPCLIGNILDSCYGYTSETYEDQGQECKHKKRALKKI